MKEIVINNLTKKYKDVTAVKNISLSIEKGELVSLLGVNGAGKTTLINMLSCLINPTNGDAFVGGYSVSKEDRKVKQIIGISPQETAIANNLTVKENLEFVCGVYSFSKEKSKKKVEQLIRQFSLQEVINKKTSKLSGGYKRKVSIALSLISEPEVLFLDEPTLGLDVLARKDLWDIIKSLKGEKTIILTTHYMEEAQELSDKVAIINKGNLLLVDSVNNIIQTTSSNSIQEAFIRIVKENENENNHLC